MTTLSPGLVRVASPEPIPSDGLDEHDGSRNPNRRDDHNRISIENVTMVKAPRSENFDASDIEDLELLPPSGIAIPIGPSSTRGQKLEPKGSSSIEGTSFGSLPSLHLESPLTHSTSSQPHTYFENSNSGRRSSKSGSYKRTSLTNASADSSMPVYQSSQGPYSARYVTVSSILSRSGAAIPLSPPPEGDLSHYRSRRQSDSSETHQSRKMSNRRKSSRGANREINRSLGPRSSAGSTKSSNAAAYEGKRASNGSALEALGALFLQRDSIGKVSNLSFMKYRDALSSTKEGQKDDKKSLSNRITFGLSSVSRAWMERMSGSSKIGIRMPHERDAGQTIAQRRARKSIATDLANGSRIEGTKNNQPSFEVLISNPVYPVNLESSSIAKSPPPAPRLLGMKGDELTPPPIEKEDSFIQPRTFLHNNGPMTEPIKGVYGPGSAFSWTEPPELPPSPIGMPGAWGMGSYGWNKEEGALLLPPPLLDDQGSDAKSFEGLLGVRRMREQERARKQFEKLKARNRPAHKVGMLTAFSNFVKAAHAADKASRSVGIARAPLLQRRHTEPAEAQPAEEENIISRSPVQATSSNKSRSSLDAFGNGGISMGRNASQTRSSLDSSGRQLNTVFEARSPEANEDESDVESSDDEDDIGYNETLNSTPSLRRRATTSYLDHNQQVPIRMSESGDDQAVRAHSIDEGILSDYLDAEHRSMNGVSNGSAGPATPRIGPTMLSLPPSPWTPYGGASRSGHQTPFHVHLGMTPVLGPPGTPRLIPAMLEVAPSPFPILGGMTPFLRSPVRGPSNGGYISSRSIGSAVSKASVPSTTAPSPLALSPNESPVLAPFSSFRKRLTKENMKEHDGELTTSANKISEERASVKKSVRVEGEVRTKNQQNSKRSFLLWFLFGDLGLGSRSSIAAKAAGSPAPFVGKRYSQPYVVILSIAAHLYGFFVFLLAHLVDLGYRSAEFLSMTFWFLRWMALNLTGQTVLARCAIDAYALVSREWESVAKEDHERKGKKGKGKDGLEDDNAMVKYRGLTKWQVLKGLIELVCLQDVTRERYLEEGAGLEELKGWKKKHVKSRSHDDALLPATPSRIDLGIRRAADRKARDDKEARQALEDESRTTKNHQNDSSDDDDESDSESSDDDMVVTNRGAEILEFTKTPKVERHTYFPSSEDGLDDLQPRRPSRYSKRSLSGTSRGSENAVHVEPTNRPLVRMIKWASRLAISAYGLHVTLVDLPATFTPSGNRFSRQTFAHLSRLHHEDVLHADIQTLDSDDYSPTFYLVRDLTRKVVVVSVRGTQSLQDIIVDLEMVVDQFELDDENIGKTDQGEPLYCHAGILRAARALLSHNSTLFKTLNQALREHPDFGIVFTGHSLGGAIASTVVLLLSRYEVKDGGNGSEVFDGISDWIRNEDDDIHENGRWVTHDRSGLPAGRPIRAITFAHPATVNATLAERASRGKTPLVLSIVLGHDIIPRCGHGQARELRRVLGALSRVRRRKEHGNESRRGSVTSLDLHEEVKHTNENDDSDARIHIVTSWWEWRKLKQRNPSSLSKSEQIRMFKIEEDLWRLRCDVESDLYSAVKRRSEEARSTSQSEGDEQKSKVPSIPPSPWIGPSHKAPLHQLAARRQALDAVTLANEESISKTAGVLVPAGRSIWIYEGRLYKITSPLSFFSLPDFHARMFSEHFPSAYEDWLEKL